MEERANRLAHFWRAVGLHEGDTVAVIMENNEHVHAVMWAARRSRLHYALVNTHLTAAEAAYIVDNSGAKAAVGSRAMRPVCERLAEHRPDGLPDPGEAAGEFAVELLGWLRDRLAHYKCPRSLSFEAQLPRTDTGKLYKQQLVAKYSPTV
ncbi:hypothetical protein GCM10009632_13610 [Mycolicibacterium alvei]